MIGTITGTDISATVSYGTDITGLVASFSTTGVSVTVGGTAQVSGVTTNNFTNPVTYRVTAENGSFQDYTVTVTIVVPPSVLATSPTNGATDFSINDVIIAIFSKDMDPATISTTNFSLVNSVSAPVTGTVTYDYGF